MKYLAIIIAIIFVIPVYGQRKKKDDGSLEAAPVYIEGVVYSLPRTVIRVNISALKETFQPGPYAEYAEQLLGIKDVGKTPATNWHITDVKIETTSEQDPNQVHKALGEGAYLISLTPDGCLAAVNSESVDLEPRKEKTNKIISSPEINDGFSFYNFTDTPFYITGDSTNNFRPIRVSVEQKAAEAAKRVLESRMNQYDLAALQIDGEYPDGKAYEVSLAELKRTEANYVTLFAGRTTYTENSYSFDYLPTAANGKGEVIFRISEENGIVPANDLSGRPVMIEFENDRNLVQKYVEGAKSENPNAGESGVYYRMPGQATIKIINDLNVIATARVTIAQFGEIAPVPEDLLYGDYAVQFHPETGAIKSIVKTKSLLNSFE